MKLLMPRILIILTLISVLTVQMACNSNPTGPPVTPSGSPGANPEIAQIEGYISLALSAATSAVPILQANEPAVPAALVTDTQTVLSQLSAALKVAQSGDLTTTAGQLAAIVSLQQQIEGPDLALITDPTIKSIASVALGLLQIGLTEASNLLAGSLPAPAVTPGVAGAVANPLSQYAHAKKWDKKTWQVHPCPGGAAK